jgi:hypothetical protein
MKRFAVLAGLGLLAALALSACGSKSETLKLVGHSSVNGPFVLDNPPKGGPNRPPSPGDQFGVYDKLTRNGKPYGFTAGSCTAVTGTIANCAVTGQLPKGQLAVEGLINFTETKITVPITGGTGKYKNARGYIEITNNPNGPQTTTPQTLHITY